MKFLKDRISIHLGKICKNFDYSIKIKYNLCELEY